MRKNNRDNFRGTTKAILDRIAGETRTVLLAFSRGKDSLATWIVLREAGFKVTPFHQEIIPGLEFVERSLRYYEQCFDTHIYRVVHPNFYHWLTTLAQQPPERGHKLDWLSLPRFRYPDVQQGVARTAGLPLDTWCATGTRSADSPTRRHALQGQHGISPNMRSFSPLADWTKQDVIDCLRRAQLKLPIDYKLFGRSFDGIDHRYLYPLREHLPEDYQRVIEWFPWAGLEFTRAEFAEKYGQAKNWKK